MDSVKATPQGIRRLRDRIRDQILREKQQLRENRCKPSYGPQDLAEQAGVSFDTWRRFVGGRKNVRRDSAEAIAQVLGLDLADLIELNRNQRPSDVYVERQPFESECYNATVSPSGAFIRVKGPHGMGKTWFVEHLLKQVQEQQYQSVTLSFLEADGAVFNDLQTFLMWFCRNIGDSLELPDQLEERWQDGLGKNRNCTNYFEDHLLAGLDTPLVLILDDVDLVFKHHTTVADDFCTLLRSWHDKASRFRSNIWQNLRLVIVHSTDIYGALDINSSPLNVGDVFSLRKFNLKEVMELIQPYNLHWQADQVEQMMALTGGNPYLIHEALNYLRKYPEMTLEKFLHNAPTPIGPYHNYLEDLLSTLQQNSNLAAIVESIVNSTNPIQVETADMFQLYSMGLVEVEEGGVVPSCKLYRRYFHDRL